MVRRTASKPFAGRQETILTGIPGVLGVVIVVMGGALVAQLASGEDGAWAPATCLVLVAAVPVLSFSRTWPAARPLGR